jgi:predicted amidohydrolase YtcJ
MSQDKRRQRGFSRRKFMQSAAASAAAAAGGTMLPTTAQAKKKTPHLDPDVILQNGKIYTMDADATVARSVSIKDGRFMAVETGRGHIRAGPRTRVVDLRGHTVVPGIIDNHNHLVLMGNRPGYHTPLENAHSIDEAKAIIGARAREVPRDAWITTIGGFHFNHLYADLANRPNTSGRFPTLAELDSVAPNNPVWLSISFNGPSVTNTAGRNILNGLVVDGQPINVAADGAISGGGGQSTRVLLHLRRTLLNAAERRRSTLDAMKYAASLGVTTHLDQGAFQATNTPGDGAAHEDNFTMHFPFLEVYEQRDALVREGKAVVRLRINFLHMETDDTTPELLQRLKNAFPFFGNEWVKTGGIGEFIAQGVAVPGRFLEAARRVAKAGWRAEVHSLGVRATPTSPPPDFELEISAFKTVGGVDGEYPGIVADKRWVIAHVPGITQASIEEFKSFGGSLSLTGWRFLSGTIPAVSVTPFAGPPFRWIVDSGIHAGMSSDGMQIAPMNPWIHMYYATTGINASGVVINPGQQITRAEVLRLYTADNGWFLREENELGTIEVGKLADLVVLNNDFFTVSNEDLKRINSVLTIIGGKVMHDTKVLRVERERDEDED